MDAGHVNANGQAFGPASVKSMLDGPMPRAAAGAL